MSRVTIRLQPEGSTDGETSRLATALRLAILDRIPEADMSAERTDSEKMDGGSLIVAVISHVAVMLLLEAVKTYWELHPGTLVKYQHPDGTVVSFRGATPEFIQTVRTAAGPTPDRPA